MSGVASETTGGLVGRSVKRQEDNRLLRGHGRFVADVKLPGMVHAAVLRSQHAHARITRVDVREVREDARTIALLTAIDVADFPPLPNIDAMPETRPFFQPVLATDKVRYVGEPIAVVVAADRYEAEDLLERIDVGYEVLPAAVDSEAAMQPDAAIVHDDTNVADVLDYLSGPSDAVDSAPNQLRRRFVVQRHAATPIETRGVVAHWDEWKQQLSVWTPTQVPHWVKRYVCQCLGLPPTSVRVISPDVGGAFGAKIQPNAEDVLIAHVARTLRRPVKWIEDRSEHFVASTHGREQYLDVEVGFDDAGVVSALRTHVVTNTGAYLSALPFSEPCCTLTTGRGQYRIPHFAAKATLVVTNKTPMNPFRGVGMVQAAFALERMMDLVARELGLDPVEVRTRNLLGPDELPHDRQISFPLQGPTVLDSGNYPALLEEACRIVDYDNFRKRQQRLWERGSYIGIGIGAYVEPSAMGPYEPSKVVIATDGSIVVTSGVGPSGQGTQTTLAQVAADVLQVSVDDVKVVHGDTDLVPDGIGSYGSRAAAISGSAVHRASGVARERLLSVAAEYLEAGRDDLQLVNGEVTVKDTPTIKASFAELAQAVSPGGPLGDALGFYAIEGEAVFRPEMLAHSSGVVIATVEVDVATCEVNVEQLVMVGDCGTMINPLLVDGQYEGGLGIGLGGAVLEELVYGDDGQPQSTSFMHYLLPQLDDMPEITIAHQVTPTPLNPLGAKGAGESGSISSPVAIANAVSDALRPFGVEINHMPITPHRIYELLSAAGALNSNTPHERRHSRPIESDCRSVEKRR